MKGIKACVFYLCDGYLDSNYMIGGHRMLTHSNPDTKLEFYPSPSYCVLIQHPEAGNILFDISCRLDSNDTWPESIVDSYQLKFRPAGGLEQQLASVGLKPEDINYVVISHMHLDHVGNIGMFADTAEFFIGYEEIKFASACVLENGSAPSSGWYIKDDVLTQVKKYHYIDRDTEIFPGITVLTLPGHTPGSIGLMAELESGTVIITSDAMYNKLSLEGNLPGICRDPLSMKESFWKIKTLAKKHNAEIWFGHDPEQIHEMKLAPEFY